MSFIELSKVFVQVRDLDIREEYFTGETDLTEKFYKPCINSATTYDRSVGFFRSSVFILIGPEVIKFAQRGGKIRLICSPSLTEDDFNAISDGYKGKKDLENRLE